MKALRAVHLTPLTSISSQSPAVVAHDAAAHASESRRRQGRSRLADMAAYEATNRRILYRLWSIVGGVQIDDDEPA